MTLARLAHLAGDAVNRWSTFRLVSAVCETPVSVEAATRSGLDAPWVMAWHPVFWRALPERQRANKRAICFFHHYVFDYFDDPAIVAAVAENHAIAERLQASARGRPVHLAEVGGAESALAFARREHPTGKLRLLVAGNARAPMASEAERRIVPETSRKGEELILPIAARLDPGRFAWVFSGKGWEAHVSALRERGWTVIWPGSLEDPLHFAVFGEGDVYLLLSRLEGAPLPLLETMGLGLWPVATPVGIAPEILSDGDNGHLLPAFDGGNVAAVAEAVASHLRELDREALQARRERVRRSVAHRIWPRFRAQIEAILDKVCDSPVGLEGPPPAPLEGKERA